MLESIDWSAVSAVVAVLAFLYALEQRWERRRAEKRAEAAESRAEAAESRAVERHEAWREAEARDSARAQANALVEKWLDEVRATENDLRVLVETALEDEAARIVCERRLGHISYAPATAPDGTPAGRRPVLTISRADLLVRELSINTGAFGHTGIFGGH